MIATSLTLKARASSAQQVSGAQWPLRRAATSILGSAGTKLVPDVVLGEGKSSLADVLLAKMATAKPVVEVPALTNGASKS